MPDYSAGEAKLSIVPDISGFQRKLEADLKKIDAELAIRVSADTAQARADINRFRDLERAKGIQIGVETSLSEANAEMAAWRARQEANRVKVRVDADTGGALKKIEDLDSAFSSILGSVGGGLKISLLWSGIGELPAVTLALTQVIGAVQQLAQAGLVLPGIFAGAGASFATLTLGLNGVKDAYDAVAKAAKPTLSEQAQNAREVTAATNAHRNAVAEEAQAERDRTQAVKDARHALEDLNLQLRGGKISEQQAINNALRQRRDLQRDLAKGQIKDSLDLQQRLLDIQEADQSVAEARQRNLELQEKAADANQKGVTNADRVVAANERVTRAQQAVAQSSDALAQAVGKPGQAVADAMANLSPNAQQAIKTLADMQTQFQNFQNAVQDNLFAGIGDGLKTLVTSDLPVLQKGLGGLATAWNGTLKQLFTSLGSDSSKGLLDRILGDTSKAQDEFTKAIDPLVKGIGTLTAAGADALPRLADDLKSVADRFNSFITKAEGDGSLSRWINDGITGFEHLGNTLINIGSSIGAITRAAGGGQGLLAILEAGSKKLSEFLNSTEGQNKLKQWFEEGGREIREHIIPALKALPGLFKGIVDAGTAIANVVVPPLTNISKYLGEHKQLVKDVIELFLAWKGISFAGNIITQITKISDALGTPGTKSGGKGGKGGKLRGGAGLLGKIGLLAAGTTLLDDALTPDDDNPAAKTPPPTAGQVAGDAAKNVLSGGVNGSWFGAPGIAVGATAGALQTVADAGKQNYQANTLDPAWDEYQKSAKTDDDAQRIYGPRANSKMTKQQLEDAKNQYDTENLAASAFTGNGYAAGGPTPPWAGPLPDGGYHAVVHPEEWMLNKLGRKTVGDQFAAAANRGVLDPTLLPHFDVGGPGDGRVVDGYGNPVTPGMLPGPSTPLVDPSAPIAPNPAVGGAGQILSSALSGLPGPISNLTSLIPGLGGQAGAPGVGGLGAATPGLWGLLQAGGDQNLLGAWGQQTGDYLANWGANFATKFATTLYTGVLDFFGLGGSILSPSNPWFQAGAKSLGILNAFFPGGQGDGSLQIGTEYTTAGDGSTYATPTFGTSGTPTGLGGGLVNQLSKASSLGGASVNYTPDFLLANGIAPLYTRQTDASGKSIPQIPQWANQLAAAFNLTATSHSDSTLHGGQSGRGDTKNTNAGWAFDFSGKPEDEQRFADFLQNSLRGQVLQAIWQNPATGQQLGIAGGQVLGRDQYYTTAGGSYADHTDHVHWATDVAPALWDPVTGKSKVPGIPDIAPGSAGATSYWWAPGSAAAPGALPVPLPAGASGGGRGALLNLALAAQQRSGAAVPAGTNQAAVYRAMLAAGFGPGEWEALNQIVTHESSWKIDARNPSSGAYGLFQFLGHQSDYPGGYSADPAQQGAAGLSYIKQRYGSPSSAWSFWQNHHWYDEGGFLPQGLTLAMNQTGKPEAVLTPSETAAYKTVASHIDKQGAVVQPITPSLPDVQHKTDQPRGTAVIPSAPTTPLPAPVAPPPAAPADDQAPAPAQYAGPAPVAPASTDLNHNLSAINTGIASGAQVAGNLASMAASAASFGAGGLGAGGGIGSLVSGLITEGGKIATDVVNVGSSFLVGNVTPGTTPNAYGELNFGAQNVPRTAADNRTTYNVQAGYKPTEIMDAIHLKEAQDMQARLAQFS